MTEIPKLRRSVNTELPVSMAPKDSGSNNHLISAKGMLTSDFQNNINATCFAVSLALIESYQNGGQIVTHEGKKTETSNVRWEATRDPQMIDSISFAINRLLNNPPEDEDGAEKIAENLMLRGVEILEENLLESLCDMFIDSLNTGSS